MTRWTAAATIANDSPFCEADGAMDRIKAKLQTPEAMRMSLSEIDQMLTGEGHELIRNLLQGYLDLRAAQEAVVPVTGADGVERTQVPGPDRDAPGGDAARRGHGDAEAVPGARRRGSGAA